MKLKVIQEIRTNNFTDQHVMEKITNMWQVAASELSNYQGYTYGLYYNYESNYQGDYTLCVAIEQNNGEESIDIPRDTEYAIFTVDTEDEQGIFNTWQTIWKQEEAGQLKRAYTFDYEKYAADGSVEIFIAIK